MVYTTGLSANAEQAILVVVANTLAVTMHDALVVPPPPAARSPTRTHVVPAAFPTPFPPRRSAAHRGDARSRRFPTSRSLRRRSRALALAVTRAPASATLVRMFSANAENAPNTDRGPARGRGRVPARRSPARAGRRAARTRRLPIARVARRMTLPPTSACRCSSSRVARAVTAQQATVPRAVAARAMHRVVRRAAGNSTQQSLGSLGRRHDNDYGMPDLAVSYRRVA
ncbi:hypothetical protein EV121DRAFT_297433 [Schizophyllum commune]